MSASKTERNAEVRLAFSRGASYGRIAAAFGVTPERVRQIVDPAGHKEQRRRRAARRAALAASPGPPVAAPPVFGAASPPLAASPQTRAAPASDTDPSKED